MLSSLIKILMDKTGLTQKALAELLGISIDRVKSLTSGRVKKLTRDESEVLIRKLHVRGDWLATGEGPMLQSPKEREFNRRLDAVRTASEKAGSAQLSPVQTSLLQEILYFAELGDFVGLANRLPCLSPEEEALLDNYRHSPEDQQRLLRETGAAFAKSKVKKAKAA